MLTSFSYYFFNVFIKAVGGHLILHSVANSAAWNNICFFVANSVINSIQAVVWKRFSCFSNGTKIAFFCAAVMAWFLAERVKNSLRDIPTVTTLYARPFAVMKSNGKIGQISALTKLFRNKSFAFTATRFSFTRLQLALFNLMYGITNAQADPIRSFSIVFDFCSSFDSLQKTKFLSREIAFHV